MLASNVRDVTPSEIADSAVHRPLLGLAGHLSYTLPCLSGSERGEIKKQYRFLYLLQVHHSGDCQIYFSKQTVWCISLFSGIFFKIETSFFPDW